MPESQSFIGVSDEFNLNRKSITSAGADGQSIRESRDSDGSEEEDEDM